MISSLDEKETIEKTYDENIFIDEIVDIQKLMLRVCSNVVEKITTIVNIEKKETLLEVKYKDFEKPVVYKCKFNEKYIIYEENCCFKIQELNSFFLIK